MGRERELWIGDVGQDEKMEGVQGIAVTHRSVYGALRTGAVDYNVEVPITRHSARLQKKWRYKKK